METNETTETTQETTPIETPNLSTLDLYGESSTVVQNIETPTEIPVVTTPKPEVIEETQKVEQVRAEPVVAPVKEVEKSPEFKDDYSKQIYEAVRNGKTDELYKYLQDINTDFNAMSDADVIKRNMKISNPTWTDKYIDVEFRSKYGNTTMQPKDLSAIDKEYSPEEYEEAVQFNDKLETREILLDQAATDARLILEAQRKTIEFPKINTAENQVEQPMSQDQIDELNLRWEQKVETDLQQLSDFKFKVGDEEVIYKITNEDKVNQIAYMKDYDGLKMAQELGWVDANGSENPLKIAQDMLKIKNFDKIIASAATQMKNSATKGVVAEIKNLDFSKEQTNAEPTGVDIGELLWG